MRLHARFCVSFGGCKTKNSTVRACVYVCKSARFSCSSAVRPTIAIDCMHCNLSPRKCDVHSLSVVCSRRHSCDSFMREYVCACVCGHFKSTCTCISLCARTFVHLRAHASVIVFESGVMHKNKKSAPILVLIHTRQHTHMRAYASIHALARKHTQADTSIHTRIRWQLICELTSFFYFGGPEAHM